MTASRRCGGRSRRDRFEGAALAHEGPEHVQASACEGASSPATKEHPSPLAQPATVHAATTGIHVAAADGWLRILTIEHHGTEVPAEHHTPTLPHGSVLGSPQP